MNPQLAHWNAASDAFALSAILGCCGARRWAALMVASRPVADAESLHQIADTHWAAMQETDWLEAFATHPRIGECAAHASAQSLSWSRQEQSGVTTSTTAVLDALAEGNARYEEKFGFTYIVCATGKSAAEMFTILERRLQNSRPEELREAAEQQRQILHIRLGKWLAA